MINAKFSKTLYNTYIKTLYLENNNEGLQTCFRDAR
jgi:hypothetical protein